MMAIVLSLAMVVTVLNYTPSQISAASSDNTKSQATSFPRDQETKVGAWYLYQGVEEWGWDGMTYTTTGSSLGATTMFIENNRDSDYQDDLVYSLYAKLKNHTKSLIHSVEYTATMNIKSTKAGTMVARINDNDYRFALKSGTNTYTYKFTYNNEKGNDVQFFMGLLKDGTEVTISSVKYTSDVTWTKVPNNNANYTTGKWRLFANYVGFDAQGNDSGYWGSMAYNTSNSGATIGDTKMKVTGVSGWLDAYSCMGVLEGYAQLAKYSEYTGTIKINSSKATKSGKKLRVLVDEKKYDFSLSAGDNTLNIPKFAFAGQSTDVVFGFDQLEVGTEITVSQVTFTKVDATQWSQVPNDNDKFKTGAWYLYANTQGVVDGEDTGLYGAMSYITSGTTYKDTTVRVDGASGWLGAYATVMKLQDYLKSKLTKCDTYTFTIKVNSSKATASGKKLRIALGGVEKDFSLAAGDNTLTITGFKYYSGKNDDIVFALDQLPEQTQFKVTDIAYTKTNSETQITTQDEDVYLNPWYVMEGNEEWAWADIAYVKSGTGLGDTTFYIDNQGKSNETYVDNDDDRIYSLQTKLKNYAPMKALEDGVDYTMTITVNTTKAGKIMVTTPYGEKLTTLSAGNNTITRKFTHNSSLAQNLSFGVGVMPNGTQFKVTNISFTKDSTSDWIPVPNAEEGFTVGPWTLYANYVGMVNGQDSGLWGKMQYKTAGTALGDTTVKVKSSTQYLESYSVFMKLDGYLNRLNKYDSYKGTIKVNSSKATASGKKLRVIVNGKNYDFALTAGANTLTIPTFKYDETGLDVLFELDELTADTEFKVTSISFAKQNTETQVPANKETTVSPWHLKVGDWAYNGLAYTNSGSGIGDTTFYVSNSRDKDWEDCEYSIEQTIPNKLGSLNAQGNYKMSINITSNKAGTAYVRIDETLYPISVTSGTKTYTIEFKYLGISPDFTMFTGLFKDGTVFTVNSLTLTDMDSTAGWIDLKNDTDTTVSPWLLHATYFGMVNGKDSGMWGKMAYKKNSVSSDLGDTTVKLKSVSGWLDAYSCFMKLPGYTSKLTEKDTYKVTIKVNSTKATVGSNKLRVIMDWNKYDYSLSAGDNTLVINDFKYLAKDPASGSDDTLFELDCLPADTEFTVKSITFTKTNSDVQLPRDKATQVGPWTLYEGPKEWAWDSMSYVKSNDTLGGTTMYIHNDRDKDYQDDLVYSLYAMLKNSTASLEDSYRYNLKFTLTSNKAGTIRLKLNGEIYDVAIQTGTHTYTQEFKYNVIDHNLVPEADDLYFYMGILKDDTQINISSVNYEKANDYIILPRDKETKVGCWTLYEGIKEWAWNSLAYKTVGNGIADTTFYIENDRDKEYSDDLVYSLYAKLPNKMADLKAQTNYKMNINITSDKAGLVAFKIDEDIVNLNITAGTKTYEVPFKYRGISKDFMMYLGKIQDKTTMKVNSLSYVDQDAAAGWIDVPNSEDGTSVKPWVLHSNYTTDLDDGLWGILAYKKTGTGSGVSDTSILVKCASGWADAYAAFAELPDYNKNLVENDQYKGTISIYSSKATTKNSTTGKDNMLRIIIDGKFYTYKLAAGNNTITIPTFKFTGESTNILFELDELEAGTEFKVNSINFAKQNQDTQLPTDKETQVGPWALYSGPKEWAWDYLSYVKNDNTLGGTTMYIANNRTEEYSDDLVYSLYAKLPNYLADLEDTYRYKVNIQITSNKAGTIRAKINDILFDLNVTSGTKTYTVEFKYNKIDHELVPAADDVYFYLGSMKDGTVLTIPSVSITKANDYIIPPRGQETKVGPWTIYCGIKEWAWDSLAYKTTGSGIADTKFYIENDREEEYSDDLVYSLYAKLANKLSTLNAMTNYRMNINITSDKAAKFTFKLDAKLYVVNIKKGTYTYNLDFKYTGEDNDFVMFLGEVGNATTFNVNSLSFTDQDAASGWTTIADDTDTEVSPWTLHSVYLGMVDGKDSGMWGKLAYKKSGTTNYVGDTTILVKSSSGWLEAYSAIGTLKNYNKSLVENDTYKFTLNVNSSKATTGDNKLRIIMDGKMYDFALNAGDNTLTIPGLRFTGESTDILFELDQLEAGTEFKVKTISHTKTNADTQLPTDTPTKVGPWTLYSGPKEWAWDYLSYTKADNTLGGTTMYITNNRDKDYQDDLVYSLYAKLANKLATLEDSYRYKATFTIKSTKAGNMRVKMNDNIYDFKIKAGTNSYTQEFKYNKIDLELVPEADDLIFFMGLMPNDSVINITDVKFEKSNDYTILERGAETDLGPCIGYCGIKEWAWNSLAYKATGNDIEDIEFYIENDRTEDYSDDLVYSLWVELKNQLANLDRNTNYRMNLNITSSKTGSMLLEYDAQQSNVELKEGTNDYTIEFSNRKYSNDLKIFLGLIKNGTFLRINKVSFTNVDAENGWKKIANGKEVVSGPWVLSNTYADDPDAGQYGQMMYKKTNNTLGGTEMWVKSVSGWYDAYAVTAKLEDYTGDLLKYNKQYYATIEVESDKSAPSGGALRVIIDNNKFDLALKKGTNTYQTKTFTNKYSSQDILFVFDKLYAGTQLKIKSITFTQVGESGEDETTQQTTTKAPTTQAPTTKAPTTQAPTTKAPTTQAPTTKAPTTAAPTTKAPTTVAPTTKAPTTQAPTTKAPTTVAPTTKAPTTQATTASGETTAATVAKPGRTSISGTLTKKRSAKKILVTVKKVTNAEGYHAAAFDSSTNANNAENPIYEEYFDDITFEMESDEFVNKNIIYVRVRSFRWDGSARVFGDWSTKKKVTIEYDE